MTTFKLLENVGWHVPRLKWWCLLPAVDLASVLTPEIMAPILANTEVQQRLMPYLPSGESLPQSTEELHNTLSSPQFQQVEFAEGLRSSDFCVFLIWKAAIVFFFRDIYKPTIIKQFPQIILFVACVSSSRRFVWQTHKPLLALISSWSVTFSCLPSLKHRNSMQHEILYSGCCEAL